MTPWHLLQTQNGHLGIRKEQPFSEIVMEGTERLAQRQVLCPVLQPLLTKVETPLSPRVSSWHALFALSYLNNHTGSYL
jgi:hypothetical protein